MNWNSLLADDSDPLVKLIIFAAVAVFWGIGALASMAKKVGQAKAKPLPTRPPPLSSSSDVLPFLSPNVIPPTRPVARPLPPPLRPPSVRPPARAYPAAPPTRAALTPPALPTRAALTPPALPARTAPNSAPRAAATAATAKPAPAGPPTDVMTLPRPASPIAASLGANSLKKAMKPGALTRQILLTELLRPPIALRE